MDREGGPVVGRESLVVRHLIAHDVGPAVLSLLTVACARVVRGPQVSGKKHYNGDQFYSLNHFYPLNHFTKTLNDERSLRKHDPLAENAPPEISIDRVLVL
jgi:hypothetical protein